MLSIYIYIKSEKYALVNPYIRGDLNNTFTGKNSLDAANKAYLEVSIFFNKYLNFFSLYKKLKVKNLLEKVV